MASGIRERGKCMIISIFIVAHFFVLFQISVKLFQSKTKVFFEV